MEKPVEVVCLVEQQQKFPIKKVLVSNEENRQNDFDNNNSINVNRMLPS